MKLIDILEARGFDYHTRSEYDWNREAAVPAKGKLWNVVNKAGKVIRPGLSQAAAKALAQRSDLIKKYGPLYAQAI